MKVVIRRCQWLAMKYANSPEITQEDIMKQDVTSAVYADIEFNIRNKESQNSSFLGPGGSGKSVVGGNI